MESHPEWFWFLRLFYARGKDVLENKKRREQMSMNVIWKIIFMFLLIHFFYTVI